MRSDAVAEMLQSLDAFPKVDSALLQRTRRGGLASVAVLAALIVLLTSETWRYVFAPPTQQFIVDPAIPHTSEQRAFERAWHIAHGADASAPAGSARVPLMLDVSVGAACNTLVVILTEPDGTRAIVDALFAFEPEDDASWLAGANGRSMKTCRIRGVVPVARVRGVLAIRPVLSETGGVLGEVVAAMDESTTFAHHVHGLVFGMADLEAAHWSLARSPLAGTSRHTLAPHEAFSYFVSVVPVYEAVRPCGCPVARTKCAHGGARPSAGALRVRENRYALGGFVGRPSMHPGLVLHFDFEPLAIVLASGRPRLASFMARAAGIVCGVYTLAMLVHRVVSALGARRRRHERLADGPQTVARTPSRLI